MYERKEGTTCFRENSRADGRWPSEKRKYDHYYGPHVWYTTNRQLSDLQEQDEFISQLFMGYIFDQLRKKTNDLTQP
jgi:hypothetical protein